MPFVRRHWPILFLALVPLLPLWKCVFLGEAIGPFDQIRQMAPWNGPAPEQPWDVLQADGVLQFYGWRDLVFESWSRGEIPFRNPYQLAGVPLLANSQSGGFYPPHILMGVLHVPTALAITLLAWLHLFWAGLGAYLLSRKLGAREIGGVIAGAGFSLSAFMLSWTALASVPTTVAWIPWVLLCALNLMPAKRRKEEETKVEARRSKDEAPKESHFESGHSTFTFRLFMVRVACLSSCLGMMLLAGHLQFAAYGLMALSVLALGLLIANIRSSASWIGVGGVAISCLFGGLLASAQLLPVLNLSSHSHRKNVPSEEGYQAFVGGALAPAEAAGILFPSLLGNPTHRADALPELSTYYPAIEHRGANFAETAIGIGPLAFIGLLFVPWRRIRGAHVSFAAIGILAILVAFGTPFDRLLYFGIPGWSSTGSPGRCGVLLVLAACVLAGVGFTRVELERPSKKELSIALAIGGVIAALNIFFAFSHASASEPWIEKLDPQILRTIAFSALASAIPGVVAVLLAVTLGLQAWARRIKGAEGLLLGAAALLPLLTLGPNFLRSGDPDLTTGLAIGPHERVGFVNDDWQLLAASPKAILPPNIATLLRIRDIGGYDSLLHQDSVRMLHEIVGGDAAPPANGNMELLKPNYSEALLDDAGVTKVFQSGALRSTERKSQIPYEMGTRSNGRAYTDEGLAEFLEDGPNRIVLRAKGRHLSVKELHLDGWSAKVDGRHASLEEGKWLELALPGGESTVELAYVAPGFTPWPSALALALLSGLAIACRWKNPYKTP